MVVLAVLVVILAIYALNNKRKKPHRPSVAPSAPSEENLGGRQRLGTSKSGIDCNNVALDSPDFARCATTLGAARSLYPRRPGNSSRPVNYEDELGASRLKGEAFPFTQKSGPVQDRDTFKSKPNKIREKMQEVSGGGVPLQQAFLGAAVSPSSSSSSSSSLLAEREMATKKLQDVNEVSSYVGGNLNLLNPYN